MKKALLIFSVLLIVSSCKKEVSKTNTVDDSKSNWQEISTVKKVNYNELKPYLEKNDDTTYIVNFWATWCAPCIKELPYFEKIKQEYASKNVEVLLVSLDFPKQVEKKLIPFINKKQLHSEVIFLNDADENVWIKAIDSTWSGALPATLIYNKNARKFYEQSFDYIMLETELKTFLKS